MSFKVHSSAPSMSNGQTADLSLTTGGDLRTVVQGPVAHDAAIVGNPIRTGSRATTSQITSVANGDVVDGVADISGRIIVIPFSPPETQWSFASATTGIVNTTTAVTIKTAAGAGFRNYIRSIQVDHDTLGSATELAIRDGAAGTVLWRCKLKTTALPITTINFDPPLKGTANTLLEVVTLTATLTGGVFINAQGHTGV